MMFGVGIFIGFDYFFFNKHAKLLRVGKCFFNYCLQRTGFLAMGYLLQDLPSEITDFFPTLLPGDSSLGLLGCICLLETITSPWEPHFVVKMGDDIGMRSCGDFVFRKGSFSKQKGINSIVPHALFLSRFWWREPAPWSPKSSHSGTSWRPLAMWQIGFSLLSWKD